MATSYRTVEQDGSIILYIEVRNTKGVLVDSDYTPLVSIFPFDKNPRLSTTVDGDADELDQDATLEAQGIYSYTYAIDSIAHVGTWFDRWKISIDGVESVAILDFSVISSTPAGDDDSIQAGINILLPNNVVVITITTGMGALDGTFLPEQFQYYFSTTYNPLYATVKQLRLRAGGYLKSVPDDTLNLSIFEASLEADSQTFGMRYPPGYQRQSCFDTLYGTTSSPASRNSSYLAFAKNKYVTCLATWFLLSNTLGPSARKKRLADFSIEYGDSSIKAFIDDLRSECNEWESVLNSGGVLGKGTSLPMSHAQRGVMTCDNPRIGRRLDGSVLPASNTKTQLTPRSAWRHGYE